MKRIAIFFVVLITIWSCAQEPKENETSPTTTDTKEVLLVGTFHYNNPGLDAVKTKSFDILNEDSQEELNTITSKISEYQPTKIFVEWPHDGQQELDSLYQLYLEDRYFTNDSLSGYYLKNEIFQLAFRVAKANNIDRVYGIDYMTSFPLGEVMKDIKNAGQTELQQKIQGVIDRMIKDFNDKIEEGVSLTDLTYYLNKPEMRDLSNDFHNNIMLLAGDSQDFNGPLLTSEWFKRNLYMWSLIQKGTTESDERIMVLVGAGHAAMFDLLIEHNDNWKVTELEDIM